MGRVVITGAGAIAPIGKNFQELMAGITGGKKGIRAIRSFLAEPLLTFGAEVNPEFPVEDRPEEDSLPSSTDRKIFYLEQALDELLCNTRVFSRYSAQERTLILGCGLDYFDLSGYVNSEEAETHLWHEYSKNSYKAIRQLADQYDIAGGVDVNVSACVASNQAIGLAFRMLKQNRGKLILAGGVDSMLNPLHYMGFYKLGALSAWTGKPENACRPFDKDRCGLVLGEGAAIFLLQRDEEAEPETKMAEIAGYASTMDAYTVTDPQPDGWFLAQAGMNAIAEAGIRPDDIDCVHLHGTGTLKNAPAEAQAMKRIFAKRYTEIPVFSMKGQVGHLIAACGAMELCGVIYSLQRQQVPPTINFEESDPNVPLRVITGTPLEMEIRYVLKLNSAFGGQNAAFVVKRIEH